MLHQVFEPNLKGCDYVVGDIHGMHSVLMQELASIPFDFSVDRLFSVGDLIDRGPDSEKVLDLIDQPWFFAVRGNHEEMMINGMNGVNTELWIQNGGSWVFWDDDRLPILKQKVEKLEQLPFAMTVKHKSGNSFGICHSEPPQVGNDFDWEAVNCLDEMPWIKTQIIWSRSYVRFDQRPRVKNIYKTIHGHTPLDKPKTVANAIFIDLGCFYTKKLCIISLDSLVTRSTHETPNPITTTHL